MTLDAIIRECEQAGKEFALRVDGSNRAADGGRVADRVGRFTPGKIAQYRGDEHRIDQILEARR